MKTIKIKNGKSIIDPTKAINKMNESISLYDILSFMQIKVNMIKESIDIWGGIKYGSYLYEIENTITNKKYIGYSCNPARRLLEHSSGHGSKELYSDIIKYGLINFTIKCWTDKKENEYVYMNKYNKECLYNKRFAQIF